MTEVYQQSRLNYIEESTDEMTQFIHTKKPMIFSNR